MKRFLIALQWTFSRACVIAGMIFALNLAFTHAMFFFLAAMVTHHGYCQSILQGQIDEMKQYIHEHEEIED